MVQPRPQTVLGLRCPALGTPRGNFTELDSEVYQQTIPYDTYIKYQRCRWKLLIQISPILITCPRNFDSERNSSISWAPGFSKDQSAVYWMLKFFLKI